MVYCFNQSENGKSLKAEEFIRYSSIQLGFLSEEKSRLPFRKLSD